ncbi:hypothetical protein RRG08_059682 [Elysia crispata]|uniref:Uncharacterized protein n=1 Tax=Elysia crispata TaxID=231223 RepID=A0AAE1B501_9GAST|nr:hypothetical protein RRG08_059682 [Elysia crispata]
MRTPYIYASSLLLKLNCPINNFRMPRPNRGREMATSAAEIFKRLGFRRLWMHMRLKQFTSAGHLLRYFAKGDLQISR